ncbi:MAG: 3'(2'),5'-bisphosphate nucleotidase CysQ [Pseudomonadota bacterium]
MPGPEPRHDLDLLTAAAQEAGRIAMGYFRADPKTWDKSGGKGRITDPVSEADLHVDRYLRDTLCAARPDYGWLSEETEDDATRQAADTLFIVDPIDGTRSFLEGSKTWATSLAVVQNGQPVAAVVHLPARNLTYTAARGAGATCNGAPLTVSPRGTLAGADLLATKWNYDPRFWAGGVPEATRSFRSSLAYRMAITAEGRFDAMFTLRDTWEWDIAAGALLVEEAGGTVVTATGAPLRFNSADARLPGVIAGPHALTQALLARGPRLQSAVTQG